MNLWTAVEQRGRFMLSDEEFLLQSASSLCKLIHKLKRTDCLKCESNNLSMLEQREERMLQEECFLIRLQQFASVTLMRVYMHVR